MAFSSSSLFLAVVGLLLLWCVAKGQLELVYSVGYQNGHVSISVQSTDPLRSISVPDLVGVSASPLITLSTCTPGTPSQDGLLPTTHTLLTTSHFTHSSDGGLPTLSLPLPSYLMTVHCLEVTVDTLSLGPGFTVSKYREKFTAGAGRVNMSQLLCDSGQCEVVDSHWLAWNAASLLHHTITGEYSLVNYIINSPTGNVTLISHPLPDCVSSEASLVTAWRTVTTNSTCAERFTPTNVYLASQLDLFVTGNALLYSPDSGSSYYQLVTPDYSNGSVISFAVSPVGRMFGAILSQNGSTSLWYGWVGGATVRLHPSALLDHLLQGSLNLTSATLAFNCAGILFLDINSTLVEVPVGLLLSHVTSTAAPLHTHSVLRPHVHTLTTSSCPYQDVIIAAPVCGRVTRSEYREACVGVVCRTNLTRSLTNCSLAGERVPREIFLERLDSYQFTIECVLQPTFNEPSKLLYTAVLRPDTDSVSVTLTPHYHPLRHSTVYTVTVRETRPPTNTSQWRPGTVVSTVDLTLKVRGSVTDCVDLLSPPIAPDFIETTVHVGCPPGLSLTFDPNSSHAQFEQYCDNTVNISCYYFRNEFRPVFRVVDEVTGERGVYTGPYTLRVLAGGGSLSSMSQFISSRHVEASIWRPVNSSKQGTSTPVYYHGDSGIVWVCATASPCGETIPWGSLVSEYYLLIEASNWMVGEGSSYCVLSHQFTIRLHGLSMGTVTLITSLLVFLTTLGLLVLTLFLCWLYRDRLARSGRGCEGCGCRRGLHTLWTRLQQILAHRLDFMNS